MCWYLVQALRASAEVGDEATARVLMDSAGLTPYDCDAPYSLFCYDSRGARYDVPMYCLHEPRSLIPSERVPPNAPATGVPPHTQPTANHAVASPPQQQPQHTVTTTITTASGITISSTAPASGAVTDPIPITAAAGGGGGGVLMPGQLSTTPVPVVAGSGSGNGSSGVVTAADSKTAAPIAVAGAASSEIEFKVRLSNGEADIPMSLAPSASIGELKARIAVLRPAIPIDKQRVIFSGALLKDSVTIAVAKIKPKAIVQIMVTL